MPTKKKKYNARFPPARIKKIMQSDEEVGKVAAPVPVIISRALELFVEALLKKANDITSDRGARTLTPSHLKLCINSERRFDFLKELVSNVPDLQGDRDEPAAPGSGVGGSTAAGDLNPSSTTTATTPTGSTLSASANNVNKTTSRSNNSSRPPPLSLPRQLSTPKPRGRPPKSTLTEDLASAEFKAGGRGERPKKRRRKLQKAKKFMDDDNANIEADDRLILDEASDGEEEVPEVAAPGARFKRTVSSDGIVTCTVTTGHLQTNGDGSNSAPTTLGFTLSFPETKLSSSPVKNNELYKMSTSHESKANGVDLSLNKNGTNEEPTSDEPLALVAHDRNKPVAASASNDVDEDYDS